MELSKPIEAFDTAMDVRPIDGEVVVLGPDRIALSLTVDAAEESGRRLLRAAQVARRDSPGEKERGYEAARLSGDDGG